MWALSLTTKLTLHLPLGFCLKLPMSFKNGGNNFTSQMSQYQVSFGRLGHQVSTNTSLFLYPFSLNSTSFFTEMLHIRGPNYLSAETNTLRACLKKIGTTEASRLPHPVITLMFLRYAHLILVADIWNLKSVVSQP